MPPWYMALRQPFQQKNPRGDDCTFGRVIQEYQPQPTASFISVQAKTDTKLYFLSGIEAKAN